MEITSTNIAAHFMTCTQCNMIWRSTHSMICPLCAQIHGTPFRLTPQAYMQLMDAMMEFEGEEKEDEDDILRLALAMERHCFWYNYEDPWFSQACWIYLRDHLGGHPNIHILRAMEIFDNQFRNMVIHVDENGNMPDNILPPLEGNLPQEPIMAG